jgi:hypothetical protein
MAPEKIALPSVGASVVESRPIEMEKLSEIQMEMISNYEEENRGLFDDLNISLGGDIAKDETEYPEHCCNQNLDDITNAELGFIELTRLSDDGDENGLTEYDLPYYPPIENIFLEANVGM